MEAPKVIINNFIKSTHKPAELKDALFHAAEAAQAEGWTFMETSFQLGGKAKDEGLSPEEAETIIRRAFSADKRSQERESNSPTEPSSAQLQAVPAAMYLDPRLAMGLDTQSIELLQNHRIDPEALSIPWPSADWSHR